MDVQILPNRGKSPPSESQVQELIDSILGFRRFGPPPFLVRNLSYVKEHKDATPNKVVDLRWSTPSVRGQGETRQLLLKCFPKRCVLPDAVIKRKFGKNRQYSSLRMGSNLFHQGKLRMWLAVVLGNDECIAFGVREKTIRLWPKTVADAGGILEDLNACQSFDLSAVMAFIAHFPSRMSIIVEVYAIEANGGLGIDQEPVLRGEHCLLDTNVSLDTSIENEDVVIELHDSKKSDVLKRPAMGLKPKAEADSGDANNPDDPMTNQCEDEQSGEIPRREIGVNGGQESGPIAHPFLNGHTTTNAKSSPFSSKRPFGAPVNDISGRITIQVRGCLNKKDSTVRNFDPFSEHVLVRCSYKSDSIPNWEGLNRHDFICPWCHRNCRRLRTLLYHFDLEHEKMEIYVDAMQQSGEETNDPFFTISFNIDAAPAYRQVDRRSVEAERARSWNARERTTNGTSSGVPRNEELDEHEMVNRARYPLYPAKPKGPTVADLDLKKLTVRDEGDSDATVAEDDAEVSLEGMTMDNWKRCKHCERPHRCIYESNIQFCGEWCEIAYASNLEGGAADGALRSLASYASAKRAPRINFAETLGKRTLYHVVSLNPVLEEHFDEEEPDSEDEVDHSWRLRITEDKVKHLDGASAKERVLWILWNRYAHESYPAPGAYAERYTRYSLELFAFEYGDEIRRLHLRIALIGFLRALHVHGLIDADAFKSVLLCLDGKKKRGQCQLSRRAEVSVQFPLQRAKSKKGAKARVRRKR